jgi:hypothetical protein
LYKANTPQTVESLNKMFRACGWKGGKNVPQLRDLTNLVQIDVRKKRSFERDGQQFSGGFEVAFVNPLSSVKQVATDEEQAEFFGDLSSVGSGDPFEGGNDGDDGGYFDEEGVWVQASAPTSGPAVGGKPNAELSRGFGGVRPAAPIAPATADEGGGA